MAIARIWEFGGKPPLAADHCCGQRLKIEVSAGLLFRRIASPLARERRTEPVLVVQLFAELQVS